jgi:hypothetical protein
MSAHLKAMSRKLWRIVNDCYIILDAKILAAQDEENEVLNDYGVNVLFSSLDVSLIELKVSQMQMRYGRSSWKFMRAHQVGGQGSWI